MKSITLEELKEKNGEQSRFQSVTVGGSEFVIKRMDFTEYLSYIDWYQDQGEPEDMRSEKFDRIIRDSVCVDDNGTLLFVNGPPSEYLQPHELATLGSRCMTINGMWEASAREEPTAKN